MRIIQFLRFTYLSCAFDVYSLVKYNRDMKGHGRRCLRARAEISAGTGGDICEYGQRYPPAKPCD